MIIVKDDTNVVNLKGELEDKLEFSHEIFGEKFYSTKIKINRLSNSYDILPMTISERLLQECGKVSARGRGHAPRSEKPSALHRILH